MSVLTDEQRQALALIGDSLIPAALGMPSFTGSGAEAEMTDHVVALRPELLADLRQALDSISPDEDPAAATERLNRNNPDALGVIGLIASSAYYLMPGVRSIMGYKGQEHRPAGDDEEHDYLRDNLLQPVIDRGPIYRDPEKS